MKQAFFYFCAQLVVGAAQSNENFIHKENEKNSSNHYKKFGDDLKKLDIEMSLTNFEYLYKNYKSAIFLREKINKLIQTSGDETTNLKSIAESKRITDKDRGNEVRDYMLKEKNFKLGFCSFLWSKYADCTLFSSEKDMISKSKTKSPTEHLVTYSSSEVSAQDKKMETPSKLDEPSFKVTEADTFALIEMQKSGRTAIGKNINENKQNIQPKSIERLQLVRSYSA